MFIQSQAPPVSSIATTTTISRPPLQTEEGLSTVYEVGRSSSIPEYTPTRPSLDEASFRLAKHLAQNISDSPSQGKGISFEEEHSGDDKTLVSKLREEIEILRQEVIEKNILLEQHDSYITKLRERDELKSKQISDLQTDLGSLTAFYFGLKCKLFEAFGDKFQSIFNSGIIRNIIVGNGTTIPVLRQGNIKI